MNIFGSFSIVGVILFQLVYTVVVLWFAWQFLEVFRSLARSLERIGTSFETIAAAKQPPEPGSRL